MYVITGATGNTGSVVASQLLDAGQKVRVVVRDAAKARGLAARGAEVAVADLSDSSAFERALAGASGLYLLSPPDLRSEDFVNEVKERFQNIARIVQAARVPHVVLLSSIAAQHRSGTGPIVSLHHAERALSETGAATTFVRASYFVENWAAVLPAAKQDAVLPSFLPKGLRVPMVATRDIGITSARALLDGGRGRRVINLAGPADLSPDDVASALGRLLGKTVTVAEAPLEAVVPTFTSFGLSRGVAELYREMYSGIISGQVAWEPGVGEPVRGQTPLEQTLRGLLG